MLAEKTIVEQHLDARYEKAHIYFIVEKPLSKKSGIGGPNNSGNQEIPAIEVKSEGKHGIMYCSPSIHKNGHPYHIIGTYVPTVLNTNTSEDLDNSIDEIYERYGIKLQDIAKFRFKNYSNQILKICEGNNRSGGFMRVMESLISRNRNILSEDKYWHCLMNGMRNTVNLHSMTPKLNINGNVLKDSFRRTIPPIKPTFRMNMKMGKPEEKSNLTSITY